MAIKQEPFVKYNLEEEKKTDSFTVWFNKEDREMLKEAKKIFEQTKDSTALKDLAWYGYLDLIGGKKTPYLLKALFKNKRNNKRNGIVDFE